MLVVLCRRRAAGTHHSSSGSTSLHPLQSSGSDESVMEYLQHLEGLQFKLGKGWFIASAADADS